MELKRIIGVVSMRKKAKKIKDVFKNCKWRQIALKMSYNGRNFTGFEKSDSTGKNSVEEHLFKALKNVKIINTDEPT